MARIIKFSELKKILVISPHFPPSNLAAVHRARLFAKHLPEFGWKPIVLTVHERYYEEALDWKLLDLVEKELDVYKANAYHVGKFRIVGDIGLRAFIQLYRKAYSLIREQGIDFLIIHVPSFYTALLGRLLYHTTGVKYGIDYIDPWVHSFPGSDVKFSRAWFSTKLARILEPLAVRKASLIIGVADGYYSGVLLRNPKLKDSVIFGAMPYGGEEEDHHFVIKEKVLPYLFERREGKIQLVYAGAMLPNAYGVLEEIFSVLKSDVEFFRDLEIHFIGTGSRANDPESYNIKELAEKHGVWGKLIYEYPKRIPYLDVLAHLNAANGVFILGSTDPHYTPSKVFQGVLSRKPILAVLHRDSTALEVINRTGAGMCISIDPNNLEILQSQFRDVYSTYVRFLRGFDSRGVDLEAFDPYNARSVTKHFSLLLDKAVGKL